MEYCSKSPQLGVAHWRHLAIETDYYDNKCLYKWHVYIYIYICNV